MQELIQSSTADFVTKDKQATLLHSFFLLPSDGGSKGLSEQIPIVSQDNLRYQQLKNQSTDRVNILYKYI